MTSAATHSERMKALQQTQRDRRRQARDPERGLVLVHTGKGKGKSTAAFGVVARALGWGHRVAVVQFIKGKWKTGERQFFSRFPDQLSWYTMGEGFTWDTQDRERDIAAAQAAFRQARTLMEAGDIDLLVLDEINIAIRYEYLDAADVIAALEARSPRTGVVLTGRDADPRLLEYADLVSEMVEIKHPFHANIRAQRGIDY